MKTKNNTAMIIEANGRLAIGKNRIDCATGSPITKGGIVIQDQTYRPFTSTLGCSDTADALILAARKEGTRVASLWTQSI